MEERSSARIHHLSGSHAGSLSLDVAAEDLTGVSGGGPASTWSWLGEDRGEERGWCTGQAGAG